VEFRFNAEEWETLSRAERMKRCRILAHEAETLAEHSAADMKASYLELAMQWKILAEEMARHELGGRPRMLGGRKTA
jgi:hypothetical protein